MCVLCRFHGCCEFMCVVAMSYPEAVTSRHAFIFQLLCSYTVFFESCGEGVVGREWIPEWLCIVWHGRQSTKHPKASDPWEWQGLTQVRLRRITKSSSGPYWDVYSLCRKCLPQLFLSSPRCLYIPCIYQAQMLEYPQQSLLLHGLAKPASLLSFT